MSKETKIDELTKYIGSCQESVKLDLEKFYLELDRLIEEEAEKENRAE